MRLFGTGKNIFFLFAFLLLLILSIVTEQYFKHQSRNKKIVGQVQSFVENSRENLDKQVRKISEMDSLQRIEYFREKSKEFFSKRKTEFLYYKNNSLERWSSNRIPIPDKYDPELFDQTLGHFSNSYCIVTKIRQNEKIFIGLRVLKYDYPYENNYLQNHFNEKLDIPSSIKISRENGDRDIKLNGETIFKLNYTDKSGLKNEHKRILFLFFFISLLFLYAFLYNAHKKFNPFTGYPKLFVVFYAIDVIIVRVLIAVLDFPASVHDALLFDPGILGINSFFPSLGDALLNVITILAIVIVVYKEINFHFKKKLVSFALLMNLTGFLFIIGMVHSIYWTIESFVWDSSVMMNLHEIFAVDFFTIMAFLILIFILLAFYLLTVKIITFALRTSALKHALISLIIAAAFYFIVCQFWGFNNWEIIAGSVILILIFLLEKYFMKNLVSLRCILVNIIIFSAILTFLLHNHNKEKEQKERKLFTVKLASQHDPVAESMYLEAEKNILTDDTLDVLVNQKPIEEDLIISYILHNYFKGYWDKYNFRATICAPKDSLILQPKGYQQNCYKFFEDKISQYGHFTFSKNLFYLDNDPWFSSYIAKIPLRSGKKKNTSSLILFLEMNTKFTPEGLVYPELLVDKNIGGSELFTHNYSVAKYKKNELIASNGSFQYYINLNDYKDSKSKKHFFYENEYNHFYYPINNKEVLIASMKTASFTAKVAPFAYILLFIALISLLLALVINPDLFKNIRRDFKTRLQVIFFTVLFFTFILIGIISVIYLKNLNEEKNIKLLREKTHSILIEVEHKLSDYPVIEEDMYSYVNELMYKFSSVFFTDINMYAPDGKLIATSRPEIYDEGLVSEQINSELLTRMEQSQKTMIIHKEKIGELEYLSAYMPFRNMENEVIAYLNLPYYAKQSELENEIADFLAAFINIYVILLAIAISLVLVLTNFITRPLNLIREYMRRVKVGAANEKIELNNKDEIGELVNEYNKMIDELERNADLLMRSQRESAWREMARQVAHEIKNPLTPMKLNVQQLKKSWEFSNTDQEQKMQRITDSLLEQIENLSAIASEFSDFAKMPVSKPEVVNMEDIINHSIELYNNYENVRIFFKNKAVNNHVKADYQQLIRVFNNVIDNAVQAIPKEKQGMIEIEMSSGKVSLLIKVTDNGKGITVEKQKDIFAPSFTTKSSGMGLGLTMVKNIINNAGGKVWFESMENKGTTFFIELPYLPEY